MGFWTERLNKLWESNRKPSFLLWRGKVRKAKRMSNITSSKEKHSFSVCTHSAVFYSTLTVSQQFLVIFMQNLPHCLWLRHKVLLPHELLLFIRITVKISNTLIRKVYFIIWPPYRNMTWKTIQQTIPCTFICHNGMNMWSYRPPCESQKQKKKNPYYSQSYKMLWAMFCLFRNQANSLCGSQGIVHYKIMLPMDLYDWPPIKYFIFFKCLPESKIC